MKSLYRIIPALLLLALGWVIVPTGEAQTSFSFDKRTINGVNASVDNPTALQFGPDGRLYVSQQNGTIWAFTLERNDATTPPEYDVTDTEEIDIIQSIQNRNDDGSFHNTQIRQITSIYVNGTATNPVIYVGSSDYRIGGGADKGDINLDTNSGVISRLTWTGSNWDHVQLVRGLPRSEENHANNDIIIDEATNTLYTPVGGSTNAGGPSNNFAFITEYAYSAAIISVDLDAIEAMPIQTKTENGRTFQYIYDLPTLDDPTRPNLPDGSDPDDPFGGNDGLNQAKVVPGSPVQIYSPGYRNAYDVVLTEAGQMYTVDNGANSGWGGYPVGEGPGGTCTNNYDPNEPGFVNNQDNLHHVTGVGFYAGHPTPVRGNPAGAGLYTDDDNGNQIFRDTILPESDPNFETESLPVDWPPYPVADANPVECDYLQPGNGDGALATWGSSTNGITEYTASNFEGGMQGDLLMASFNGKIYRADLINGGTAANISTFADNFGATPLDVTAQSDTDIFPGTVWAATYGADDVVVFEPNDFLQCTGNYDNTIDEDSDGYTNADEIDNGTDPCGGSSAPADFDAADGVNADGFLVSDLNDPDDDNDTIPDTQDAFAWDRTNGGNLTVPFDMPLLNGDPGYGFFGLGLTGWQTNGTTDYLDMFDTEPATFITGGAVGLMTMPISNGTALAASNNDYQEPQLGINTSNLSIPFRVEAQINGPYFGGSPQPGQELGLFIGTGTQSDYVKVVLHVAGNGDPVIRVIHEEGDTVLYDQNFPTGGIGGVSSMQLYFDVDPNTNAVQPAYSVGGGQIFTVGNALTVGGDIAAALDGTFTINGVTSHFATGFTATSGASNTEFQATWDYINADYAPVNEVGNWELLTSEAAGAPNDRHENGFVNAGGSFYLLGGRGTRDVDIYNPRNDTWTSTGINPPVDMHHIQPVVLDGLIYIVNGYSGNCCDAEFGLSHVYIFDPVANEWFQGPEIPETRRRGSTGVIVYNDKIYSVGGLDGGHGTAATSFDYFDVYDPYANTWQVLPDAPRARDHFNAVEVNGKLYLAGGRQTDVSGFFNNTIGEVDVYDFGAGTWSTLPAGSNIPTERAGTMAARLGNEVVVIGGEGNGNAYDVTEALNTSTNTWRDNLATLNQERHGTGVAVCNDTLYVAAGNATQGGGNEINTQERYSLYGATNCAATPFTAGTPSITPDPVNFGDVPTGDTATETITLTNDGGTQAMLVNSLSLLDGTTFDFTIAETQPFVLAPGESVSIDVTYTPTATGAQTDTLTIATNAGDATVTLNGTGQELLEPTIRINAGGPTVGDTPIDWTLDNGANPPYSSAGAISTGGFAAQNFTDAPNAIFDQERYGQPAYAVPNMPAGDYRVKFYLLEGWAGVTAPGQRVFDVTVEGQLALDNYDIWANALAQAQANDPSATSGTNIGIMESYDVSVTDGTLNINLVAVTQNPAIRGIEIVPLSATADTKILSTEEPDGTPTDTVFFFNTPQGDTATPQTLVLKNVGSTTLSISYATVDGTDAAAFTADPAGAATLAPGETVDITVGFTPTKLGLHQATLNITHDGDNGPLTTVSLQGEGGPPGDQTALYRINTGGPQVAAADGSQPAWSADTAGAPSPFLSAGGGNTYNDGFGSAYGGPVDMSDPSLAGGPAAPATIFTTERYDIAAAPEMLYEFPVTAGTTYEVRLYFAELFTGIDAAGQRVFDVAVEGTVPPAFNDIDPFGVAGAKGAFMRSYALIAGDGTLSVEFQHDVIENPAIKGIEIVQFSGTSNTAPTVTNPGDQYNAEGDAVTLPIDAIAPEADQTLTYEALNLPPALTIDPATGVISGTISPITEGGTTVYVEENGVAIIEMEGADNIPGGWLTMPDEAASATNTKVINPTTAAGGQYLLYNGGNFFGTPGTTQEIVFPVRITNPGTYRVELRNQIGEGTNTTEHNDVWVKVESDAFYAEKGGTILCPKGADATNDCTGGAPVGAGGRGYFKAFSTGGSNWVWSTLTNDGDGYPIYARFDQPGTYNVLINARSQYYAVDRLVLVNNAINTVDENAITTPPTLQELQAQYDVTVTATDDGVPALADSVDFTWFINMPQTNVAPVVDPIADQEMGLGDLLTFDVTATDADNDPISLTATMTDGGGNPVPTDGTGFVTFTDNADGTGTFIFDNPTVLGTYAVTVTASDGTAQGSDLFTLTVNERTLALDAPLDGETLIPPAPGPNMDVVVEWTGFSPATDDHVHLTLDEPPVDDNRDVGMLPISGTYTFPDVEPGTHTMLAALADTNHVEYDGVSDLHTFEVQGAPVVDPIADQTMFAGDTLTLPVTATDVNTTHTLTLEATMTDGGGNPVPTDGTGFVTFTDNADRTGSIAFAPALAQVGTYTVTLTADDTYATSEPVTFTLTVTPSDGASPSAYMAVSPGGFIGSSTFTANSFSLENTSAFAANIVSASVDLSTTVLNDIVFDPVGTAGDTVGKCFNPDTGTAAVGYTAPAAGNCGVNGAPFSGANDGGYNVMSMAFNDFQPGEIFTFSVDIDPSSIQGATGSGSAGSISGLELIGATVTVEFDNGMTLSSPLYTIPGPSAGGSHTTIDANAPDGLLSINTPNVALTNGNGTTAQAAQDVQIAGPAGATVSLTQLDTRMFLNAVPQCGFDVELYESNEALAVDEYTVTLDGSGMATVPVTLLQTDNGTTPLGGFNVFAASIVDASAPRMNGLVSNVITVAYPEYPNQAPTWLATLPAQTMAEGGTLTLDLSACDVEPDSIMTLSGTLVDVNDAAATPAFLTVADNGDGTGTVTFEPTFADAGDYEVTMTVTDQAGLTDEFTFTLTVTDENAAPVIDPVTPDPQAVNTDETLQVPVSATDADLDVVDLTLVSVVNDATQAAAGFATYEPDATVADGKQASGVLTFAPQAGDAGTYTVTLSATDNVVAEPVTYSFTLEVTAIDAPVIDPIANQTVTEQQTLDVPVNVTDPNDDALTVTVSMPNGQGGQIPWYSYTETSNTAGAVTGTITFAPPANSANTYAVVVTANDGTTEAVTEEFTVTVNTPDNAAPVIDAIADQTVPEAQTLTVPLTVTDADADALTVTVNMPNGAGGQVPWYSYTEDSNTAGEVTGTFTFAPPANSANTYRVTITASDGTAEPVVEDFALVVTPVENVPPQVAAINNQVVAEATVLDVPVRATDADGDLLELRVSMPNGQGGQIPWYSYVETSNTAGEATGTATFTPPANAAGTYRVLVAALDGVNEPVMSEFRLFVEEDVVSVEGPVARDDADSIQAGGTLYADVLANDSYVGNINDVSIAIVSAPTQGTATAQTGAIEYVANGNAAGSDTFTYTITDATGQTSAPATVTVVFSSTGRSLFVDVTPKFQRVTYNGSAEFGITVLNTGSIDLNSISLDGSQVGAQALRGLSNFQAPQALGPATHSCDVTTFDLAAGAEFTTTCRTDIVSETFRRTFIVEHIWTDTRSQVEATVEVAANQAPTAVDDSATATQGQAVSIAVLGNDSDSDGELNPASVRVTTRIPNASGVTVDPTTGNISFVPDASYEGVITFTYEVCDDGGLCTTATVTVTVNSTGNNDDDINDDGNPDDGGDDTPGDGGDGSDSAEFNAEEAELLLDDVTTLPSTGESPWSAARPFIFALIAGALLALMSAGTRALRSESESRS